MLIATINKSLLNAGDPEQVRAQRFNDIEPMKNPIVVSIAQKHNKTLSQVLLRFMIELGVTTIPKSSNPQRIRQNIDIFDFELSTDEYEQLVALDKGPEGRIFHQGIFAPMSLHPDTAPIFNTRHLSKLKMPGKYSLKSTLDTTNMRMPVIGLGTWQATGVEEQEIEDSLKAAIDAGYRHIDTAYVYKNEKIIGRTLKKIISSGKVKREDLFIVTKLPPIANRPEYVKTYLKKSLESLKLDYVDLYLIHNPVSLIHSGELYPKNEKGDLLLDFDADHLKLWKGMEEQVDAGLTKAIGISNFNLRQVKRIYDNSRIKPSCNQVELHVYLQQKELVDYCKKNNIVITAYGPLGSPALKDFTKNNGFSIEGFNDLEPMKDPIVVSIAQKHNKTPAQVLIRFMVELGVAAIPKSSNPHRLRQNIDIFDFELSTDEHNQLVALDKGAEGRMFHKGAFVPLSVHPEYPF